MNKSFKKKWLKENWNGNLNVENENSTCYEKKREHEIAIISAQNQAEVAQLEHQILDKPIEGKVYETGKVSTSLPFFNR